MLIHFLIRHDVEKKSKQQERKRCWIRISSSGPRRFSSCSNEPACGCGTRRGSSGTWSHDPSCSRTNNWTSANSIQRNTGTFVREVAPVPVKVLPDGDGLLDKVIQILRDGRGEALGLQDTKDLVAGDETDLGNSVRIPQDDT